MRQDLIVGSSITVLGIIYLLMSANIAVPNGAQLGIVNARFMPNVLGILICVLGIAQLALAWFVPRDRAPATERRDYRSLLISAVLMVLYAAFIEYAGFIVVSVIYLFAEFWILTPPSKKRKPLLYAAIALILPIATYFIFRDGFDMLLPVGFLTFL